MTYELEPVRTQGLDVTITSDALAIPITLAEVKDHVNVDFADHVQGGAGRNHFPRFIEHLSQPEGIGHGFLADIHSGDRLRKVGIVGGLETRLREGEDDVPVRVPATCTERHVDDCIPGKRGSQRNKVREHRRRAKGWCTREKADVDIVGGSSFDRVCDHVQER